MVSSVARGPASTVVGADYSGVDQGLLDLVDILGGLGELSLADVVTVEGELAVDALDLDLQPLLGLRTLIGLSDELDLTP